MSLSVLVEVYVRRQQSAEANKYQVSDPELLSPIASRSVSRSVARSPGSLYREEERAESLDSPMTRVTDLVFNPVALIVGLYVFILGYGKVNIMFMYVCMYVCMYLFIYHCIYTDVRVSSEDIAYIWRRLVFIDRCCCLDSAAAGRPTLSDLRVPSVWNANAAGEGPGRQNIRPG